jgi:hypothetical protein
MKKLELETVKVVLASALLIFTVGTAWAGLKENRSAFAFPSGGGQGALGTARNSTDFTQFVGCTTFIGPDERAASCIARGSSGAVSTCFVLSTSPIFHLIQSVNGDSFISFSADSQGFCSSFEVQNSSIWPAKNH